MIVCLDFGLRYIGIAVTDPDEQLTLRYGIIDQKQQEPLAELKSLIEREKVTHVLVGLPVSLSGRPSEQTLATVAFLKRLRDVMPSTVRIQTVDETLTSREAATRVEQEAVRNEEVHAEAARLMLNDFLEKRRRRALL